MIDIGFGVIPSLLGGVLALGWVLAPLVLLIYVVVLFSRLTGAVERISDRLDEVTSYLRRVGPPGGGGANL